MTTTGHDSPSALPPASRPSSLAALRERLKILLPQKSHEEIIAAIEQVYHTSPDWDAQRIENEIDLIRRRLDG